MKYLRRLIVPLLLLLILAAAWLYWWRPQRVDMAAYVPADSMVYLEANSMPEIASGLVKTDSWKALATASGIRSSTGEVGWLSRLAAWTGIGPADVVVLSRAQVAVTVLGVEAADAGDTLKIRPRIAVVAETHTGEGRTRAAVQKLVGDFARRAYREPEAREETKDGLRLMTWTAPGGERRLVAATEGSVAVVGNDEEAVRACLAVRHNQRPALAGNAQMEEIRRRMDSAHAVAFGYVSPSGAGRLLELAATAYVGQLSENPRAQSVAASVLLPLANKVLGGAGWSAGFAGGAVEDHYFLALQNGVDERLRVPLSSSATLTMNESALLPGGTYSLSHYNYRDPAMAWRGLNSALSSQVGALESAVISGLLNQALQPYGIEEPVSFLRSIGPEIVTARLDQAAEGTLTIVLVRDEKALRDFVARRLGASPRTERVGDAELLVSREEERGAASFVGGQLLIGSEANVRRCLEARAQNRTLAQADNFQRAARAVTGSNPASVVTYTSDEPGASAFMRVIASQRGAREGPADEAQVGRALGQLSYAVSETRLVEGGFEKRTRSSFGQLGTLVTQFAPDQ